MNTGDGPFEDAPQGLLLRLRVQPGASRDASEGTATLADGQTVLKVRLSAPPEDGKANAALVRLLAKTLKLPKSRLRLVAGETARRKTLLIEGDPGELRGRNRERLRDA